MRSDELDPITPIIDTDRHPIDDVDYAQFCRSELDATGALVLPGFFRREAIGRVIAGTPAHSENTDASHTAIGAPQENTDASHTTIAAPLEKTDVSEAASDGSSQRAQRWIALR